MFIIQRKSFAPESPASGKLMIAACVPGVGRSLERRRLKMKANGGNNRFRNILGDIFLNKKRCCREIFNPLFDLPQHNHKR
jgi:hypothetical protein